MRGRCGCGQGRPLNANHEAACFIGKKGEGVGKGAHCLKMKGKSVHFSMNEQE